MWNIIRKGGPQIFTVQHSNEKYMQLRHSPFFYRVTSQASQSESNALAFLFSTKRNSFLFHFFFRAPRAIIRIYSPNILSVFVFASDFLFTQAWHWVLLTMCTLSFLTLAVLVRYVLGTSNSIKPINTGMICGVSLLLLLLLLLLNSNNTIRKSTHTA